jgi:hypothetical protein
MGKLAIHRSGKGEQTQGLASRLKIMHIIDVKILGDIE